MFQSRQKRRSNLASVIDRLHVEKVISSREARRDLNKHADENLVDPFLLQSRGAHPDDIVTVVSDAVDQEKKTKGHVCKQLQAKPSEGGSVICELCGQRSFKSIRKTLHPSEDKGDGKRVCKECLETERTPPLSIGKCPTRPSTRPSYEPHIIGATAHRASKSWHFIRRDLVTTKQKRLVKRRCDELEFKRCYLSDSSSHESDSSSCLSDEETDYISDDGPHSATQDVVVDMCSVASSQASSEFTGVEDICNGSGIVDIANVKGYCDHLVLRKKMQNNDRVEFSLKDNYDCVPKRLIKRPELSNISKLVEANSPSKNRSIAKQLKNLDVIPIVMLDGEGCSPNPNDHTYYFRYGRRRRRPSWNTPNGLSCNRSVVDVLNTSMCSEAEFASDTTILENLLKDIDDEVDILCLEDPPHDHLTSRNSRKILDMGDDGDDRFESKPARYRVIKNRTYSKGFTAVKTRDNGGSSFHKGVCRLVTVVNRKRGHYKEDSINSCFYDSTGMYCKKSQLPSFVHLDDRKASGNSKPSSQRQEIDSLLAKYQTMATYDGDDNVGPDDHSEEDDDDDEDEGDGEGDLQNEYRTNSRDNNNNNNDEEEEAEAEDDEEDDKEDDKEDDEEDDDDDDDDVDGSLTLKQLQEKFWPRTKGTSKWKGKNGIHHDAPSFCGVCRAHVIAYSSFSRSTAPIKFVRYFKRKWSRLRVCRACLLSPPSSLPDPQPEDESANQSIIGLLKCADLKPSAKSRLNYSKKRKLAATSECKSRRFSRFIDTSKRSKSRSKSCDSATNNSKKPKLLPSSRAITPNTEIGGSLTTSPVTAPPPVGRFGQLNLKVVQNPTEEDIQSIAQNEQTKYVIVQTAPTSGESKVQKLSTDASCCNGATSGVTKLTGGKDVIINGQKFKIDSEFKLNDLVKNSGDKISPKTTQKIMSRKLSKISKSTHCSKPEIKIVNIKASSSAGVQPNLTVRRNVSKAATTPPPTTVASFPVTTVQTTATCNSVLDYKVVAPKNLQSIVPKTSNAFVNLTDFSKSHLNFLSKRDLTTSKGALPGGNRNNVVLHVSKGSNDSSTGAAVTSHSCSLANSDLSNSVVPDAGSSCTTTSAVDGLSVSSAENSCLSSPLSPPLSSSCDNMLIDLPPVNSVSMTTKTAQTSALVSGVSNTKVLDTSPLTSLYGLKNAIIPIERLNVSKNPPISLAGLPIARPAANLNLISTSRPAANKSSASQLSALRNRIPISLPAKPPSSIASHLMISASNYKPWMSTSTTVSSSLVKSINELRASMTTSKKTTLPSLVPASDKLTDVTTDKSMSNKPKNKVSLNEYASVTIKGNLLPISKFGSSLKSSTASLTSADGVKTPLETGVTRYVVVSCASSSLTDNFRAATVTAPLKPLEENHEKIVDKHEKLVETHDKTPENHENIKNRSKDCIGLQDSLVEKVKSNNARVELNGIKFIVKSEDITAQFPLTSEV